MLRGIRYWAICAARSGISKAAKTLREASAGEVNSIGHTSSSGGDEVVQAYDAEHGVMYAVTLRR
ncbi:hypothetical protein GCM10017776_55770 [Streptomyces griseoluteus]|nr:hypothetical protein GCM10017776_55770 [Streptomyces griseoluteus]